MRTISPISNERIRLLLLSIIIVALLASSLRVLTGIEEAGRFASHPISGAFSIAFPLLGQGIFLVLYLLGLLVGWHQVAGGAYGWLDLGEGIAIAGLGYAIAEAIVFRQRRATSRKDETARKTLHVVSNLFACFMLLVLGIERTAYIVLTAACIGILLMHLALAGIRVPGMEQWMRSVGREGENPGEGALYNVLGVLFTISILRDYPLAAISVILILAMGDGLATFAGTRYGRHRLPWNRSKSLEGTAGFALGASSSWLAMPVQGTVLIVILAAILESLPLRVNDNIVLPVAVSLMYYLIL